MARSAYTHATVCGAGQRTAPLLLLCSLSLLLDPPSASLFSIFHRRSLPQSPPLSTIGRLPLLPPLRCALSVIVADYRCHLHRSPLSHAVTPSCCRPHSIFPPCRLHHGSTVSIASTAFVLPVLVDLPATALASSPCPPLSSTLSSLCSSSPHRFRSPPPKAPPLTPSASPFSVAATSMASAANPCCYQHFPPSLYFLTTNTASSSLSIYHRTTPSAWLFLIVVVVDHPLFTAVAVLSLSSIGDLSYLFSFSASIAEHHHRLLLPPNPTVNHLLYFGMLG